MFQKACQNHLQVTFHFFHIFIMSDLCIIIATKGKKIHIAGGILFTVQNIVTQCQLLKF
jgi:hypothetical protein